MPSYNNPFSLPTLAGNRFGQQSNPVRPPPTPGPFGILPPRPNPVPGPTYGGDPQPWGVNNRFPPPNPISNGGWSGIGTNPLTSFSNNMPQSGMGGIYYPNPVGNPSGYAYLPRQFEADKYVDTGSAFYQRNMGAYTPTDPEAQKIWQLMPIQSRLEISSWAAAGAGAYADALLKAQQAGPNGLIFNGQFMSGDQAFELIKQKARDYMAQIAQARQQGKPQPQPTDYRVVVG